MFITYLNFLVRYIFLFKEYRVASVRAKIKTFLSLEINVPYSNTCNTCKPYLLVNLSIQIKDSLPLLPKHSEDLNGLKEE
jgi:hypothetical protein